MARQDVQKLGQFVQGRGAQEAAEGRQALGVRAGALAHGAEFQDGEGLAVQTGTLLPEQHARAQGQAHEKRGGKHDGSKEQQARQYEGQVEKTFGGHFAGARAAAWVALRAAFSGRGKTESMSVVTWRTSKRSSASLRAAWPCWAMSSGAST